MWASPTSLHRHFLFRLLNVLSERRIWKYLQSNQSIFQVAFFEACYRFVKPDAGWADARQSPLTANGSRFRISCLIKSYCWILVDRSPFNRGFQQTSRWLCVQSRRRPLLLALLNSSTAAPVRRPASEKLTLRCILFWIMSHVYKRVRHCVVFASVSQHSATEGRQRLVGVFWMRRRYHQHQTTATTTTSTVAATTRSYVVRWFRRFIDANFNSNHFEESTHTRDWVHCRKSLGRLAGWPAGGWLYIKIRDTSLNFLTEQPAASVSKQTGQWSREKDEDVQLSSEVYTTRLLPWIW